MKSWIPLACFVALTGCATAPAQYLFDNSRSFDAGMDEVWPEVINFFAENNLPISVIERDSGLVVSDDLRFSASEFAEYADCGEEALAVDRNPSGSVNLFVRERSSDSATVTVNTRFRVYREVGTRGSIFYGAADIECVSKGALENSIIERIRTGLDLPIADF